MRNHKIAISSALALASVIAAGCGRQTAVSQTIDPLKLKMFSPLPDSAPPATGSLTAAKIDLGRMLYYDARLSKSQTVSCNSCHKLDAYGVDGEPTSTGHKNQRGDRNSPTVYNAAAQFVQFWDGRASDVEAQAKGPVMNPVEMAMPSESTVVAVLTSMPEYQAASKRAFPGEKNPVSFNNMAIAIGAFERKLFTPSRWDRFLSGDQTVLTPEEKAGFNTFVDAGCVSCHAGMLVGGNLYQKLGVVKPYPDTSDPGRYNVTKSESDRGYFKVPQLRNVAKTAPYFHNGKVATLEEAVRQMGEYQLGKRLNDEEVHRIVVWLNTLTGQIPADYIKEPVLPKSTPKTPKPDVAD